MNNTWNNDKPEISGFKEQIWLWYFRILTGITGLFTQMILPSPVSANPIPYRVIAESQKSFGAFLEIRNNSSIPKIQSTGIGGNYQNIGLWMGHSHRSSENGESVKHNGYLLTGLRFDTFGVFTRIDGNLKENSSLFFSLNIDPAKVVYGAYEKKPETNRSYLGISTGTSVRIFIELGKEDSEAFGRGGITFTFDPFSIGVDLSNYEENNANLGAVLSYGQVRSSTGLLAESSVRDEEKKPRFPKNAVHSKSFVVDHPFYKNKPTFPISLGELLQRKIPISEAIQIERVSKNSKDYDKFFKKASPELQKNLNSLQYEKRKTWEN